MLCVLTEAERRFLVETIEECMEYSDDLSPACEECLHILGNTETMTQEQYEDEKYVPKK